MKPYLNYIYIELKSNENLAILKQSIIYNQFN